MSLSRLREGETTLKCSHAGVCSPLWLIVSGHYNPLLIDLTLSDIITKCVLANKPQSGS